ncbi:hypothetical protein [Massilia sp. Leaf139]|uniref:hypothetical protein n=1 Tax=Massilia sp. Leaf139 TaxID=1736272 RepID=UPI0006FA12B7|nr:hypothetical protein [Massilia sp. Leaf139]KQQ97418.1 hypothetical protein ASF77_05600 [Massilia sp. Leaf139]
MSNDKLILAAAVGFAAFMVAQKKGLFKKAALTSGAYPSFVFNNDSAFAASPEEQGYDPQNPGKYVTTDDLIKGALDGDWGYTPSVFEQTANDLFYSPSYYR